MHYLTTTASRSQSTQKPTILLLHGTPKTSYYWYRLIPFLSEDFNVVAPDLRGFGATDKPPVSEGYDTLTSAHDMAALMTSLGHDKFIVHGEDRGAEFAYVLAAMYRDRVIGLSFCEMLLSHVSPGLNEITHFTQENITAQYDQRGCWFWHVPFFWLPHVPEMLIQGKEEEFWTFFMKQECYNPDCLEQQAIDEWVRSSKQPGGLRGILETYRAHWRNVEVGKQCMEEAGKLVCPVVTVGAPEFLGPLVQDQMQMVAEKVWLHEVFEKCGHSLSLEKPERMAEVLRKLAGFVEEGS